MAKLQKARRAVVFRVGLHTLTFWIRPCRGLNLGKDPDKAYSVLRYNTVVRMFTVHSLPCSKQASKQTSKQKRIRFATNCIFLADLPNAFDSRDCCRIHFEYLLLHSSRDVTSGYVHANQTVGIFIYDLMGMFLSRLCVYIKHL